MLDVIRDYVKAPIFVTPNGGYRCDEHNWEISGARYSQHMQGRAADIVCKSVFPKELHVSVLALYKEGKLPRLGALGRYKSFVHVDIRPRGAQNQIVRFEQLKSEQIA